jgi:hypothetical protein
MNNKKVIPIIAVGILLIAIGASVYAYLQQADTGSVSINGATYSAKDLMAMGGERVVEEYSGVALDELVISAGVSAPETKAYTLVGADGYLKTVTWENMQNGILTPDLMSAFSYLAKAFRVKDIVEIIVE